MLSKCLFCGSCQRSIFHWMLYFYYTLWEFVDIPFGWYTLWEVVQQWSVGKVMSASCWQLPGSQHFYNNSRFWNARFQMISDCFVFPNVEIISDCIVMSFPVLFNLFIILKAGSTKTYRMRCFCTLLYSQIKKIKSWTSQNAHYKSNFTYIFYFQKISHP